MRFSPVPALLAALAAFSPALVAGERMLTSTALSSCQDDSQFSASLFNVVFTPGNNTAAFRVVAMSTVEDHIVFNIDVSAYGYSVIHKQLDPCDMKLNMCPMQAMRFQNNFNVKVDPDVIKNLPSIAYSIPDLDASVKVTINSKKTGKSIACLEARISNGKTVNQVGVKWATAVISGLALVSSALINGLGQYNAAAHLAANALSLFSYFQSQAILGLTAVHMPPIVQAWTQDFQWSMGIIRVGFLQTIATWYLRATGGKPSTLFDSLATTSVSVQKRGIAAMEAGTSLFKRVALMMPAPIRSVLAKRADGDSSRGVVVRGIERVAFQANIEATNLFLTGIIIFITFVFGTVIAIAGFNGACQVLAKKGMIQRDRFGDFRRDWLTVLKGILYRVALIGFPQITILCLWEFTRADSPAEVALAVLFLIGMTVMLAWGCSRVFLIAKRSVAMYDNAAYSLFANPSTLNKLGFLYIQFRASAYYFIIPALAYVLLKSLFIAFGQAHGTVQAIALVLIEVGALIGVSVLRPWMDKPTNSYNIAIHAVNFVNSIFLLIFSDIFHAPGLVNGVVGVVLFVLNAVFACVLLIMIIVSTVLMFIRPNPDARYQQMADDRTSFMKSQTQLNTLGELDALGAVARSNQGFDFDDDGPHQYHSQFGAKAASSRSASPFQPSTPMFPASGHHTPLRTASPGAHSQHQYLPTRQ